MSLRGSAIAANASAVSLIMSLPAGSAVGDLAIAFGCHEYPIDIPSGFTSLYQNNAISWNVMAAWKVLTSGDISTGSITVQATGPYLPYPAHISAGLVVFAGAGGGVREYQAAVAASGFGATLTNTTSGAVLSTDTAIYWASTSSASAYPTITPGSGSATTLQSNNVSTIYNVLADQAMPGGVLAVANVFGNGNYVAVQVIVQIGLAPPGGLLAYSGMDGGIHPQLTGGMNS